MSTEFYPTKKIVFEELRSFLPEGAVLSTSPRLAQGRHWIITFDDLRIVAFRGREEVEDADSTNFEIWGGWPNYYRGLRLLQLICQKAGCDIVDQYGVSFIPRDLKIQDTDSNQFGFVPDEVWAATQAANGIKKRTPR